MPVCPLLVFGLSNGAAVVWRWVLRLFIGRHAGHGGRRCGWRSWILSLGMLSGGLLQQVFFHRPLLGRWQDDLG